MANITKGAVALRSWRLSAELTQTAASKLIGIGKSVYWEYEAGTKRPRIPSAVRIHAATGIAVEAWGDEVEPVAA